MSVSLLEETATTCKYTAQWSNGQADATSATCVLEQARTDGASCGQAPQGSAPVQLVSGEGACAGFDSAGQSQPVANMQLSNIEDRSGPGRGSDCGGGGLRGIAQFSGASPQVTSINLR